jgi:hypothetical protein
LSLCTILLLACAGCIPAIYVSNSPTQPVRFVDADTRQPVSEVMAIPLVEDFVGVVGAEGSDRSYGRSAFYLGRPSVHKADDGLPSHESAYAVLSSFTFVLNWTNGAATGTHGHLILAYGYRFHYVTEEQIARASPDKGTHFGSGREGSPGVIELARVPSPAAEAKRIMDLLAGRTVPMGELPEMIVLPDATPGPETPVQVRFTRYDRDKLRRFLTPSGAPGATVTGAVPAETLPARSPGWHLVGTQAVESSSCNW